MNDKCFGSGEKNLPNCECRKIFEQLKIMSLLLDSSGAPPHKQIVLQTRLGSAIDNIQPWHYAPFEWNQLDVGLAKYEALGAVRVNGVCPIYNCHGLTFGSRRTQVDWSPATIGMILEDDGFEEVRDRAPQIGNVVIYYGDDGKPEHSGIVIGKQSGDGYNVPLIWSKWGKGFEVVHPLGACSWAGMATRFFRIKAWKSQIMSTQNS
jgi:hypothetical protein